MASRRRQSFSLTAPPLPDTITTIEGSSGVAESASMSRSEDDVVKSPSQTISLDNSSTSDNGLPVDPRAPSSLFSQARTETRDLTMTTLSPSNVTNRNKSLLKRRSSLGLPPMPTTGNTAPCANEQEHFLQGINFDECRNLLSLPDPPTPGKTSSALRRRRQSSPLIRPLPLRDVSNNEEQDDDDDDKKNDAATLEQDDTVNNLGSSLLLNDANVSVRSKPKRARKSLCHVPFSSSESKEDHSESREDRVSISLDEDDNNNSATRKRRKKRQSLVLPSDEDTLQDGTASKPFLRTFVTSVPKVPSPSTQQEPNSDETNDATASLLEAMEAPQTETCLETFRDLRQLVHAYTLLPPQQRRDSQQAKAIQDLSGYVLMPPVDALPDDRDASISTASPNSTRTSRMQLLQEMGPQLARMDETKLALVRFSEQVTKIRVDKHRGRYAYVHVPSGRTLSPHDYQEVYQVAVLNATHDVRLQAWKRHWERLEDQATTSTNKDMGDRAGADDSPKRRLSRGADVGDDMVVCETNASLDLGDTSLDQDADTKRSMSLGNQKPAEAATAMRSEESKLEDDLDDDSLAWLPLPDRDSESDDPEIALAEQTLWAAMDQALETYSQRVLEIQAARQRERQQAATSKA